MSAHFGQQLYFYTASEQRTSRLRSEIKQWSKLNTSHWRSVVAVTLTADGRDWPERIELSFAGYSIGRWIDEDGDGVYDVLEVETRGFKGPRAVDETGLPMHVDDQTIFKERIYRDKRNSKILHDEMTMIDNALTRPWTVDKKYVLTVKTRRRWSCQAIKM